MQTFPRNWFVASGAKFGDGSRNKPFHDPWLAFRCAGPDDVIHIAAGTYFGRYDRSSWIIDCPRLTIRGGYSRDFSTRTPWQTPSVFAAFHDYEYVRENNLISGRGDHSGIVLDGLFFDASGRNTYDDRPAGGIRSYPAMDGPIASFNAEDVTIRNCVFANSAAGGVELAGDGSRFENNLLINIIGPGMLELKRGPGGNARPMTVANNNFCFAHDNIGPALGTGADCAIGVRINCPAVIQGNVFAGCGNAAITLTVDPNRVRLDRNLFHLTPHCIIKTSIQGSAVEIREGNFDELEEVGFKSAAGNVVEKPGLSGFKPEWLDTYSRHLLANYATPPRHAANELRVAAGLNALTQAEFEKPDSKGALAPRLETLDALAVRAEAKQGSHAIELPAEIDEETANERTSYRPITWDVIENPDPGLANQSVELRAGLGTEQNVNLLAEATGIKHMGILVYRLRPGEASGEASICAVARRATLAARQFEEAVKYQRSSEVESTYFLRGTYRTDLVSGQRQKVTLLVESIVSAPPVFPAVPARPQGRDWFVRMGASGGDGTRDRPFRDPFQALDKAEGGDAIHVTAGDYFGKLHSGKWKVPIRNLTLLGGYDGEFAERDPWKNPTRFLLTEDEKAKGTRDGTILASEQNSDGLILDGFIFDGSSYNTYRANGSLDLGVSPLEPLVAVRGAAPITIRNCIFVNASSAGINISCPSGTFENNIVVNCSLWGLSINAGGAGPWTIRNNSFLFACDPSDRAGTGKSSPDGTLLVFSGRAYMEIDSNIFAFADNYGVRAAIMQQNVSFNNNVFGANLFNNLTDEQYLWADGSNWERRAVADSAFASFQGNTLELPKLPVDANFSDAALPRLFSLPSRISVEQWKVFASTIGSNAAPVSPAAESAVAATAATSAPTVPASTTTSSGSSSLSSLLASLSSLKAKAAAPVDTGKATAAKEQIYCPVFDSKKAIDLALETSEVKAGAHKMALPLSFSNAPVTAQEIAYTEVSPAEIDRDHFSLDNKSVKLQVKITSDSSRDPGYFPAAMTNKEYFALSAVPVGAAMRTPLAILVGRDTGALKVLGRANSADTLSVRGTARLPQDRSVLSIVVDDVEIV